MDEYELIRSLRIDFNLIPIKGHVTTYSSRLKGDIWSAVQTILRGKRKSVSFSFTGRPTNPDDVKICPSLECPCFGSERWYDDRDHDEQLRDGDHGYIIIRGTTLDSLVDLYDPSSGTNWDDKFYNARRHLVNELNCTFFNCCGKRSHLLITQFNPSHDPRLFINLVVSQSQTQPPTVHLKRFGPGAQPSLRNFLHSLAKIRDIDFGQSQYNRVSIQFKNYKQCYKALKKLCSHSLKKKGGKRVVDYQLTLKDEEELSYASLFCDSFDDEVLAYKCSKNSYKAYNESATTQALNNRVSMLEKEFNLVKSLTENSIPDDDDDDDDYESDFKGSTKARALNHRAALLQERLDFVKSVMDSRGGYNNHDESESPFSSLALALRNRVSTLDKELSTLKAVLDDACITRTRALENRVAMLEKELNAVKDNVVIKESSHDDQAQTQALKRCKRLKRE